VLRVSHVATAPHECEGNLIFTEHGLSPYWTIAKLLTKGFDGYSEDVPVDVDGETWTVDLAYQESGIAPRLQDEVGGERLYEFRVGAKGRGERKANFLIQPRFADMRHYETGEPISTPFDNISENEGINVRFAGSNLEPDDYRALLPRFLQALAAEGDVRVNPSYFTGSVHEMSNITTYERYVRIHREKSSKIVGRTGIMQRLFTLCADEEGSKVQYKANNEDIVGYNHRVLLPKKDARQVFSGHQYGKQIKHYHPKHVRAEDESDPLYHPKLGVLLKKSLTGHSFEWSERKSIRREIDEALINTLYWGDIPVKVDATTYIADDHFDAREASESISLRTDPTPEIEANQEALLVTQLRDLCESDMEVLKTLVTDGGRQQTTELGEKTGRGISTIYRALNRLEGILQNENGKVSFVSKKLEQEISGIVERTESQLKNAADRVANLYNLETRHAASSAWQKWCSKYGAKITGETPRGNLQLRIDTVLSELKSATEPYLSDVLSEAIQAWRHEGRDVLELREARVRWEDRFGEQRISKVSVAVD